jgi:hypothetical protein
LRHNFGKKRGARGSSSHMVDARQSRTPDAGRGLKTLTV